MRRVFADSYYFFALLNKNEPHHQEVRDFADTFDGQLVSTGWVLTEFADGMAKPRWRSTFAALHDELIANPNFRLVGFSDELFAAGLLLFRSRSDKAWSLTDCISFVVMERETIREALTGDRHFEQAGFVPLFG
jgi:predicted nucleic acid-binding protein